MQAVAHFIETFVPEHYDIFLDLNREQKTFTGKVSISGEAKGEKISLHQKLISLQVIFRLTLYAYFFLNILF